MATSEGEIKKGVKFLLRKYGSLTTSEVKKLLHTVMVFDDEDLKLSKTRPGESLIKQRIGNIISHQKPKTVRDYENAYRVDKTSKPTVWTVLSGLESKKTLDIIPDKEIQRRKARIKAFKPRKINWQEVNHHRTELGRLGEEFVVRYEKNEIKKFAPQDLDRIIHLSEEQGDGAGFDIISLDYNGSDKYIEVKTTENGADTPFYMTENERLYFEINKDEDNLFIYRVFNFDRKTCEGKILVIPARELFSQYSVNPISYKISKLS